MSFDTNLPPADPAAAEETRWIGDHWGAMMALGVVLLVLGTLAILYSVIASLIVALAVSIFLVADGVVLAGTALWADSCWRSRLLHLLLGILYVACGVLMLKNPFAAVAGFTLVLAALYMAGGAMRVAFAITHRVHGSGWVLLNGVITLLLGILVWSQWPFDSLWVIGLFVGIDMIFQGWAWVMLGATLRPRAPATTGATPHPV